MADTDEQVQGERAVARDHLLDQRLDRRQAGAAGHAEHPPGGRSAASWSRAPAQPYDVADPGVLDQRVAHPAGRYRLYVQGHQAVRRGALAME